MILMTESGVMCVSICGDCDMSRRNCHPPHHDRSDEQFLREIVSLFVPDDAQKQAYLAFARELMSSIHRVPVLDFERGTKRVVMKWFARGLSGHLLWLVGQAAIQARFR
jgi:hypothetical protein